MGKYGNGILVSDGNGNGMVMGMKSLKWEGIGTKNLFPHTSTTDHRVAQKKVERFAQIFTRSIFYPCRPPKCVFMLCGEKLNSSFFQHFRSSFTCVSFFCKHRTSLSLLSSDK